MAFVWGCLEGAGGRRALAEVALGPRPASRSRRELAGREGDLDGRAEGGDEGSSPVARRTREQPRCRVQGGTEAEQQYQNPRLILGRHCSSLTGPGLSPA